MQTKMKSASVAVLATFGFSVLAFAFVQNHSLNIKGGNKSKDGGIPFPKNGLTLAAFLDFIELNGGYEQMQMQGPRTQMLPTLTSFTLLLGSRQDIVIYANQN